MFDKPLDAWPEIQNFNEKMVMQVLEAYRLEGKLPCECRECMPDMIALALNSLPPRYTVSVMQKYYETETEERAFVAEVTAAMDRAVQKVLHQPHH